MVQLLNVPGHLQGRHFALAEELRCSPFDAAWLACACLHAGAFTRRQWRQWVAQHGEGASGGIPMRVHRAMREFERDGLLAVENRSGLGLGAVARVTSQRVYRALGLEWERPLRGDVPARTLLRRLLALDYVLARPDLEWRANRWEQEDWLKKELGAPWGVLPKRVRNVGPNKRLTRYFPIRTPVAAGHGYAEFVFVDDGESGPPSRLRPWGQRHAQLWNWLLALGIPVRCTFVTRSPANIPYARRLMSQWAGAPDLPRPGAVLPVTPVRVTEACVWWSERLARPGTAPPDTE